MTRVQVRVRRAVTADAARVAALARAVEVPFGAGAVRQMRVVDETLEQRVANLLARSDRTVIVAEDPDAADPVNPDLVGMAVLADDEADILLPVPALRASHLVVAPAFRRRGVGRALLAAATQIAEERGAEHVVVSSMPGARDVNRYLARIGFVPLVSRRIAATAALRRSLGVGAPGQVAQQRRARIVRGGRAAMTGRLISRGA